MGGQTVERIETYFSLISHENVSQVSLAKGAENTMYRNTQRSLSFCFDLDLLNQERTDQVD